jgi:hypothetical protein
MIGSNGMNRAKEKLVHNFGHRISRNHNLEAFTREKGYYLRTQFRKNRLDISLEVGRRAEVRQTRTLFGFTR